VGSLVPEQPVFVVLDRPDHHIDRVVFHLEPGEIAGLVVVGLEGPGAKLEVATQSRVFGQLGRFPQLGCRRLHLVGVDFVVWLGSQSTRGVPTNDRVLAPKRAAAGGRLPSRRFELLLGHVAGVKPGAERLDARRLQKRRIISQTIPGTVVDLRVSFDSGVVDALQEGVAVPIGLAPEDGIHASSSVDQEGDHPTLAVREPALIGGQSNRGVLGELLFDGGPAAIG
jgi:hypothetical protein